MLHRSKATLFGNRYVGKSTTPFRSFMEGIRINENFFVKPQEDSYDYSDAYNKQHFAAALKIGPYNITKIDWEDWKDVGIYISPSHIGNNKLFQQCLFLSNEGLNIHLYKPECCIVIKQHHVLAFRTYGEACLQDSFKQLEKLFDIQLGSIDSIEFDPEQNAFVIYFTPSSFKKDIRPIIAFLEKFSMHFGNVSCNLIYRDMDKEYYFLSPLSIKNNFIFKCPIKEFWEKRMQDDMRPNKRFLNFSSSLLLDAPSLFSLVEKNEKTLGGKPEWPTILPVPFRRKI